MRGRAGQHSLKESVFVQYFGSYKVHIFVQRFQSLNINIEVVSAMAVEGSNTAYVSLVCSMCFQ